MTAATFAAILLLKCRELHRAIFVWGGTDIGLGGQYWERDHNVKHGESSRRPAVLEVLESRLLLSTGPISISDVAGVGVDAKSLVYSDTDGTVVTVALKCGQAEVDLGAAAWTVDRGVARVTGPATMNSITLSQTTLAKSKLTITTAKPRGLPDADNFTTLGSIQGTAVKEIAANHVDLLGGLLSDGLTHGGVDVAGISTLKLRDVSDAATLALHGAAQDKLVFSAGAVGNTNLSFNGTITSLGVVSWGDGTVSASSVGKLTAYGDFGADVIASGGIGSVTVTGGDLLGSLGSLTDPSGPIGSITVKAVYSWFKEPEGGGWGELVGGNIFSSLIQAAVPLLSRAGAKAIGSVSVTGGSIGQSDARVNFQAQPRGDMGTISTKGVKYKSGSFPGEGTWYGFDNSDLYADVTVTGKLGNVTVSGGDAQASFDVGSAGNFVITGTAHTQEGETEYLGGSFAGTIISDAAIGNISGTGGDMDLHLTAPNKIGSITQTAVTVAAKKVSMQGETWYSEGYASGTQLTVEVTMTGTSVLGKILGKGADVAVTGTVNVPQVNVQIFLNTNVTSKLDFCHF